MWLVSSRSGGRRVVFIRTLRGTGSTVPAFFWNARRFPRIPKSGDPGAEIFPATATVPSCHACGSARAPPRERTAPAVKQTHGGPPAQCRVAHESPRPAPPQACGVVARPPPRTTQLSSGSPRATGARARARDVRRSTYAFCSTSRQDTSTDDPACCLKTTGAPCSTSLPTVGLGGSGARRPYGTLAYPPEERKARRCAHSHSRWQHWSVPEP